MQSELLDYGEALAKLVALMNEPVEVQISGVDNEPPSIAYFDGQLTRGGDVTAAISWATTPRR